MHLANGGRHLRDGPHFFDHELMRQKTLIDELDHAVVVRFGPDGPVMSAAHVHEALEWDQHSCKARAENAAPLERSSCFAHRWLVSRGFRGSRAAECRLVSAQDLAPAQVSKSGMDFHQRTRRLAGQQTPARACPPRCADAGRMERESSARRASRRTKYVRGKRGRGSFERNADRDLLRCRLSLWRNGGALARGWIHECP